MGLGFLKEVVTLPEAQRRVLVPYIAWQLSVERSDFVLEGALLESVKRFIEQLDPNSPGMVERFDAMASAAGVTPALLRELQMKASLPPLRAASFTPRQLPTNGQVASGPLAHAALRGLR